MNLHVFLHVQFIKKKHIVKNIVIINVAAFGIGPIIKDWNRLHSENTALQIPSFLLGFPTIRYYAKVTKRMGLFSHKIIFRGK